MSVDVVVIGGGHAGVEAACITAKKGLSTLLITSSIDLIGQMSCNPAIGGIAKGTIVREIDALGGVMGEGIDYAGIHFKMLNRTKGMAVWGPRAQADKRKYRFFIRNKLEYRANLTLFQAMVTGIESRNGSVSAVLTDCGEKIECKAVVLCAGTFLNGIAYVGQQAFPCGRTGEPPSLYLTEALLEFGILSGRLKTGTPPRIDGRSVDFGKLVEQEGDISPAPFSFFSKEAPKNTVSCWIAKTTSETHKHILDNLDRSPLYTGKIKSLGPKYCPSIEDKVVRFGERDGHTLFLEPEGCDLREMYLNGLSTSLPFDTQVKMVHSIAGLENAQITRPGYAIEYDYFDPIQLFSTLETKAVRNLFFAGQINGTSGYEEAGCQGIVAGINAAANILHEPPFVVDRETAYTGVLIDDLVTKGTQEPYRMFTSRAEHRLLLRQDNADERLLPQAFDRGLISQSEYDQRRSVWDEKARIIKKFSELVISEEQWTRAGKNPPLRQATRASHLLKRPDVTVEEIERITGEQSENREAAISAAADLRYSGFIEKQKKEIEKHEKYQNAPIPDGFDFMQVSGLLNDSRKKLQQVSPRTLGQASRIPGITPADISVLLWHLVRQSDDHVSRETAR